MSDIIHHTTAEKISGPEGQGWEFTCPYCEYMARYLLDEGLQENRLIILNEGVSGVRHVGSLPPNLKLARPTRVVENTALEDKDLEDEDRAVVPPYLAAQIEAILTQAGF